MSNSAFMSSWMSGGIMLASITAWIWSLLPAVMLEIVQHASLRMPFFGLERSARRHGSAEKLMMICVCRSSPVTMLPTVRRAGVCTDGEWCISSSTSRRHTPASITAWIFSFGPSDRYYRHGRTRKAEGSTDAVHTLAGRRARRHAQGKRGGRGRHAAGRPAGRQGGRQAGLWPRLSASPPPETPDPRRTAAEIGERPGRVAEHGELGVLAQLLEQRHHGLLLQDLVAVRWRVTGDVAEGPDRLLGHVVVDALEQPAEDRDGARVDHNLGLVRGARRNVRERPRGLELQRRVVVGLEELDEARHYARLDHGLNRRVLLDR
mmetsp:Transcript_47674/g.132295  ORF Transcript_47674/g.132295 Transcript_47674/m.132295 type:complete len:320 (+) Transcript_47674:738-1697(+)